MNETKLREGYKRTEIGIIPEDWDTITYEKAFSFLSTATYSRDMLSKDGDVVYVHYGDVHTKFEYKLDFEVGSLSFVTKEMAKNYNYLKDGDIIMVDASEDYSGIGKSVEVKNLGVKNAISGLHTFLLRDKDNIFINGFKGYIHKNQLVKKSYDRLATGLKVFGVSKKNLKTIQIPYPPTLAEQKAIATALSDTDELIAELDRLITKKQNIKQATMQQLLTGKKRLPGFSGEWEVKRLGEIAIFLKGIGLPKSYLKDNGMRKCIHYGELFTKYNESIKTIISHTDEQDDFFLSRVNDVLMPTSDVTPNGLATASCIKENNIILGGDILIIRASSQILDGVFLSYVITQNREQVMRLVTGSTVYHLYGSDMKNFSFVAPTVWEQKAITKVLSDIYFEIESLKQKRNKYKAIKEGMMQELLTGRTRLIEN